MFHLNLTNLILATVAILGVLGTVGAFIYKRAREDQQLKDELAATRQSVATLNDTLNVVSSEVKEGISDMKTFISVEIAALKADHTDIKNEVTDLKIRLAVVEKVQQKS